MNPDYPPLQLHPPQFLDRRPEKPRRPPLPPELLARRVETARVLGIKVAALSKALRKMSDDERKAIFYKIEHDQPVSLDGTGLKPLSRPSRNVTLAAPIGEDLSPFEDKIKEFGTGTESKGHVPHEDFAYITSIEQGDPHDRLSDTLFESYETLCSSDWVVCEVELLTLVSGVRKRAEALQQSRAALEQAFARGVHGVLFEHESTRGVCRAVVRVTGKMFRTLVEGKEWQRRISWFDEKPRFQTFHQTWHDFSVDQLGPIESPPDDAPTICVVDTGVTTGNPFLAPVVKDGMLRSFLGADPDNPFDAYGHGSGVASLAAYHSLNIASGATNRAKVWVAGARILNQNNQMEENRLFSKLLEELVEHFVPLGVRIFVLAVGNEALKWNADTKRTVPRNSWIARKIDTLSREHDIVFVTCTGNLTIQDIRSLRAAGGEYPDYFVDDATRILDPGQAALALTVGSTAPGTLVVGTGMTAIAPADGASPFTRRGPGIEGDIKPEVIEYGGNLVSDTSGEWVRVNPGTNVVMASHQLSPAVTHSQGTSYAAPRAAHKLALVLKDLEDIGISHVGAELLKAMFVNSATYLGDKQERQHLLDLMEKSGRKHWLHVLGYGMPDVVRATFCEDYTTILYFQGVIHANQVAYFNVPVVAEFGESNAIKAMSVTVAHSPEVQRWGLERYFGTDLKWRMFRGDISQDEVIHAMSRDEDPGGGDSDTDNPKELKFEHGLNRRSRGVVQHDRYPWTIHKDEYSENHYTLAIAAYERWGRQLKKPPEVPFAVVVRLEDTGRLAKVYAATARTLAEVEVEATGRA
jgi:hypothetical protein